MYSESDVEQFIVFRIAKYLFALPIGDVLQVVNCPPQTNYEINQLGLFQIGQHIIKVVDLHQECNSGDLSQVTGNQSFLVLTRTPQGNFCGILVYEPPDLIEFSSEQLRSLPRSEHPVLKFARHAVVLPWQERTTTIFLLDMQQALTSNPVGSRFLPAKTSI
jgi:purine-binding chemotaxis protein CheW